MERISKPLAVRGSRQAAPGCRPSVRIGREYHRRQRDPRAHGLQEAEVEHCIAAAAKARSDPNRPGLKLKRLGTGRARNNFWSIRASRELRVILAMGPDRHSPEYMTFLNMGHHDAMYKWAADRRYYVDPDSYGTQYSLDADADEPVTPSDVPDWAVFLHDDQRRIVERVHDRGAARIRGAAGTGKSVVAIHRAAILARRYPNRRPDGGILVTSFSKSLCTHMQQLFQLIQDPPANVEFRNIHSLAYELADGRIVPNRVNRAFERAYNRVVPVDRRETLTQDYLKAEVQRVMKGRAATRDEYMDTGRFERIGRGLSLKAADRELCWSLRVAWDEEMEKEKTEDFPDIVIRARDLARRRGPLYRCAVIDETQDITLVDMQFIRALVSEAPADGAGPDPGDSGDLPPDALTVLDDSAQRIYPGGFKPRWANLNYRGSSDILNRNHRNSERIVEAAKAVRGRAVTCRTDNDDGAIDTASVARTGGSRPRLVLARHGESHTAVLSVLSTLTETGAAPEDIGILMHHNQDAGQLDNFLNRSGRQVAMLDRLRKGEPLGPGIRVGTFDRAKGMEFRCVIVMHLGADRFPIHPKDSPSRQPQLEGAQWDPPPEEQELRLLNLQRLYVGMTRARDMLILVAEPPACPEVENAVRQGLIDD